MSSAPGAPDNDKRPEPPTNLATAVAEVSERASSLVREEIELAKAELEVKVKSLLRGAVVGVTAGIFFAVALVFVLIGCAWLIYWALPVGDFDYFYGFFAMAVILVVLGVIAGLIAARVMKKGSPPVPTMAIDEAQKLRDELAAGHDGAGPQAAAVPPPAAAPAAAPPPAPPSSPPPPTKEEGSA